MNDAGVAEQLDYEIQDVYFTDKNKIAPNYERKGYITGVWTRTSETGEMDDKQAAAEIVRAQIPFDVTFKVYDYTESYGEYINDNAYGVSHNKSIKGILDPTMKQYDAQIVMRDIND